MQTSPRNLWPLVVAWPFVVAIVLAHAGSTANGQSTKTPADSAAERGLAFLSREVPLWSGPNKCYSCHNNGDGARALYLAARRGFRVDLQSTADTRGG